MQEAARGQEEGALASPGTAEQPIRVRVPQSAYVTAFRSFDHRAAAAEVGRPVGRTMQLTSHF